MLLEKREEFVHKTSPKYEWLVVQWLFVSAPEEGIYIGFPGDSVVKNQLANEGDTGSISGSGRSPGEGKGNLLQYSCLGNLMDRGAWWESIGSQWLGHDWGCTHYMVTCHTLCVCPPKEGEAQNQFQLLRRKKRRNLSGMWLKWNQ